MKFDLNAPNPTAPFRRIPSGKILERIISARLPESTAMYNLMQMSFSHPELGVGWYTLHGHASPQSWIVTSCFREDMGNEYMVSAPPDAEITEEIKDAFRNSPLFDWKNKYLVAGVDTRVSKLIYEITVAERGNTTWLLPCLALTMSKEDIDRLSREPNNFGPEVSIRPLKDEAAVKFLASTWSATKPGLEEHLRKLIVHVPSAGIYVNDELVSGIVQKNHGTLGMLYTLPDHRKKGYAKAVYKTIISEFEKDTELIPCIHITIDNESSKLYHEKLGFKVTHRVDFFESNGKH